MGAETVDAKGILPRALCVDSPENAGSASLVDICHHFFIQTGAPEEKRYRIAAMSSKGLFT
jgi:hypothetical protein